MPRMSNSVTVAANAISTNQLAGLIDEFLRVDSAVRLAAVAAATGLNVTFILGNTALINDQLVSDANRFPQIPEDVVAQSGAFAGERMILTFRNTTGAGILVKWLVDVEPTI